MSDECFAGTCVPPARRKYGVRVTTTTAAPPDEHGVERVASTGALVSHWTMARALDELDPFQRNWHLPLRLLGRYSALWLSGPPDTCNLGPVTSTASPDGPWSFEP